MLITGAAADFAQEARSDGRAYKLFVSPVHGLHPLYVVVWLNRTEI